MYHGRALQCNYFDNLPRNAPWFDSINLIYAGVISDAIVRDNTKVINYKLVSVRTAQN